MPTPPPAAPPPGDHYLTLAGEGRHELKVKRSRFIGLAAPAPDEAAARHWIHAQERRFHDARHVCYGWRLGHHQNILENRSDAGEPSGTAGEPILSALRKAGVSDAVVVVVRYFGGVKLGTGGLSRAYGEAAELAVVAAGKRTVLLGRHFELTFPYSLRKTLDHLLRQCRGEIEAESYREIIRWRIWLPHSQCEPFARLLTESTAGAVSLREEPEAPSSSPATAPPTGQQ